MHRRLRLPLVALAIIGSLQPGYSASLTTTSTAVGAGTATVTGCDGDGLTFRHTINATGRIPTVNASEIHASCAGGSLKVTLVNGASDVGSGSVVLPSSGFTGSADVAISPQPLSNVVTAVVAVVEGP